MKRRNIKGLIFFLFLHIYCLTAYGILQQFNTTGGLLSNTVYYTYKDSKGYIWFATDKGVSSYNGLAFKNYTLADGLSDNEIFKLYEDRKGRLWLFAFNGSVCYIRNDTVFNNSDDQLLGKIPSIPYLNSMCEQGDTALAIGYVKGQIGLLNDSSFRWINKTESGPLTLIYPTPATLKALEGSFVFNLGSGQTEYLGNPRPIKGFYSKGKLFVADPWGITIYEDQSPIWSIKNRKYSDRNILHLYLDDSGRLFCSRRDGLTVINTKTNEEKDIISNLAITCVTQDVGNSYWAGTLGNGAYRFITDFNAVKFVKKITRGKLYYTNEQQLFHLEDNSLSVFSYNSFRPIGHLDSKCEPLYSSTTWLLYTNGFKTWMLNRKSGKTYQKEYALKYVFDIGDGQLLLLRYQKLYKARADPNRISISDSVDLNTRIKQCHFDSLSYKLYMLIEKHLYAYDIRTGKVILIDSFNRALPVNMSCCGNYLLVTMNNRSIVIYNTSDYSKKAFLQREISFYSFCSVGANKLLVNSNKGYFIADSFKGNMNGISFKQIEYPFSAKEILDLYPLGDSIACNLKNGLFIIHSSLLNKQLSHAQFHIESVWVGGKEHRSDSINIGAASRRNLKIKLDPLVSNDIGYHYEYRFIKGESSSWFVEESNNINIPVVGFGKTVMEIKVVTANGVVSESERLVIVVSTPFYYSVYFISFVVVFVILVVYLVLVLYNRKKKRDFENEMEFMKLENRAINSLLNPHFIFNAINNIQNLVVSNDPERANNYMAMLSRLIRQNIENLQFSVIPLEKEISLVKHYVHLQNLRFENAITLEINEGSVIVGDIQIPPLLIHTFVENAIVHGFKKKHPGFIIRIELSVDADKYLLIKIIDNGSGFTQNEVSSDKTSLGVAFMRRRLERISEFYKTDYELRMVNLTGTAHGVEVSIKIYARLDSFVS